MCTILLACELPIHRALHCFAQESGPICVWPWPDQLVTLCLFHTHTHCEARNLDASFAQFLLDGLWKPPNVFSCIHIVDNKTIAILNDHRLIDWLQTMLLLFALMMEIHLFKLKLSCDQQTLRQTIFKQNARPWLGWHAFVAYIWKWDQENTISMSLQKTLSIFFFFFSTLIYGDKQGKSRSNVG